MMNRRYAGAIVLGSLATVAFGVAMWAGVLTAERGGADALVGVVDQSASASDAGFLVEVERVEFSGTAVDVNLSVRAANAGATAVGVRPGHVTVAGVAPRSAYVSADGSSLLRFPPAAWPEAASALVLTVTEVQVLDDSSANGFRGVPGLWELPLDVPEGENAAQARAVEALEPVVATIAGQEMVVTTIKSHTATVVRYQLPPDVLSDFGPKLKVGDSVEPPGAIEAGRTPGGVEAWFNATGDEPITLVFEDLYLEDHATSWSLTLRLDPFVPPLAEEGEHRFDQLVWEVVSEVEAPAVYGVELESKKDRARLRILLDGSWLPGGTRPDVVGDGMPLRVTATVTTSDDSGLKRSLISAEVAPGAAALLDLVVEVSGELIRLPDVEVVLQP